MLPARVRSALAMKIANVDRLVFNQAVADGHYPCAPPTAKGQSRIFGEDGLLGLFIFGRLLERGVLPRVAGPLACNFARAACLSENVGEDRLVHVRGRYEDNIFAGSKYDNDHIKNGTHYPGIGVVFDSYEVHVGNMRKIIKDAIDAENAILGNDDGAE